MNTETKRACWRPWNVTILKLVGIVAWLLSGCHGGMELKLAQPSLRPEISQVGLTIRRLTLKDAAMTLTLRLSMNDKDVACRLHGATVDWMVEEIPFATTSHRLEGNCPLTESDPPLTIDVDLVYLGLPGGDGVLAKRRLSQSVISVQGRLDLEVGNTPISLRFSTGVSPEQRLEKR